MVTFVKSKLAETTALSATDFDCIVAHYTIIYYCDIFYG